jgi:hypothetical protein
VERLGKETIVLIEYQGTRITAIETATYQGVIGDRVYAVPQAAAIHLFDAESGKNLCFQN